MEEKWESGSLCMLLWWSSAEFPSWGVKRIKRREEFGRLTRWKAPQALPRSEPRAWNQSRARFNYLSEWNSNMPLPLTCERPRISGSASARFHKATSESALTVPHSLRGIIHPLRERLDANQGAKFPKPPPPPSLPLSELPGLSE